jgi:DNA-directed RNA polymerase beta' subunit
MEPVQLESIQLQLYTDAEVRKLGVVQVTNPSTYDRGFPKANGVNDARMGVTDKSLQCPTCGLTSTCHNHYGFIELERPVLRLGHVASVLCILRCVCWACSRPKFSTGPDCPPACVDVRAIVARTPASSKERLRALSEACKNRFRCPWGDCDERPCGVPQPVYARVNKVFFSRNFRLREAGLFESDEERAYAARRLMPDEVRSILHHVPDDALRMLGYRPEVSHPENYVMQAHLVPPPSIRPASSASSTEARMRGENDLTTALQDIVRANNELAAACAAGEPARIETAWDKLQIFCAALINQNVKKLPTFGGVTVVHARAMGKRKVKDMHSRLVGKKGRLRSNMSGKRVDHAGRSVVGPDASHDIFQLGVPASIMRTLTFPEPVNALNSAELARAVTAGAAACRGALTVRLPEAASGGERVLYVALLDESGRRDLAAQLKPGWIVERHLRDGDWVLFNRQPSLHKASIMAFRAYEVPGAQFKLPLPCTKPFNADFGASSVDGAPHTRAHACSIITSHSLMCPASPAADGGEY